MNMSMTGLRTFDQTLHLSNVWLNKFMEQLDWDDKPRQRSPSCGGAHHRKAVQSASFIAKGRV